ncbi:MAG: 1-(5-phosphoribosyl)-5-[(5-phosphoribosylamino)methylideneamino] imidazole-4-carboxamide isomerase [Bacteroidetes bacterium]|nr:1-(5-phosphoribosyl)-5-[(5-phosphoribosylamino)methylideneamino] imidazole-4-carboxamide isomerase [Bacteroidota bacterium]
MKIIPAADILDGQVVILKQGIYEHKTVYADSLRHQVEEFLDLGLDTFHVVDLNGARGSGNNAVHIEEVLKEHPNVSLEIGGGIRTIDQARRWLDLGAKRIVIGTAAIEEKSLLTELSKAVSTEKIIIAMDLIRGSVAYHGWEAWADIRLEEHISHCFELGLHRILCTDVSRDGTLTGPNLALYTSLRDKFPNVTWIASGGVASMNDIRDLAKTGVESVIVGKAIYDKIIDPVQIRDWNISA